jgi:hypothetical protein
VLPAFIPSLLLNGAVVRFLFQALLAGNPSHLLPMVGAVAVLMDIPDHVDLTDRQTIQRKVALTGQPHIDRKALASFLKRLE